MHSHKDSNQICNVCYVGQTGRKFFNRQLETIKKLRNLDKTQNSQ